MKFQWLTSFVRDAGFFVGGLILIVLLTIAGCGGGGGSSGSTPEPTGVTQDVGELLIGITDAEGDFLSYDVVLESLTLHRQNGDIVEALPVATRIDFAELTEETEFLNLSTVPAGQYDSVSVRLDFTDAQIVVEDSAGSGVVVEPRDAAGDPLTTVDLELQLTTSDVINIRPGIPAAFSLDFDLAASNTVDLVAAPPFVTVEPFLLATPELETDRNHRVRGLVREVDEALSEISIAVRPFRHRQGDFGTFVIGVTNDTVYEVDGVGYVGADGLRAVAALDVNAAIQAGGTVQAVASERNFTAHTVVAGTSVPWQDADVMRGVVVARTGDVLTVAGAFLEFADGTRQFRGAVTVNLDEDTTVSAPGAEEHSIASLSVGQRVLIWGEQVDDTTIDASRVRMKLSNLVGEVVTATPLVVDLFSLNSRNPQRYDFTGTGVDIANDADPESYEVDTGLLGLSSIETGDLVRARGLVNEFGMAPADFNARTIVDVNTDHRAGTVYLGWSEPTATAFSSIAPDRVDVDLAEARVALKLRGVPRDYLDELATIGLLSPADGMGIYAVRVRGASELHMYRSFNDLVDELTAQLDAGNLLHRITAQGQYNVDDETLLTKRAGFVFVQPNEES